MPKGGPGIKKSPEHAAKIAAALRGKPKSESHRNALKQPKTEKAKENLRAAALSPSTQQLRKSTMLERYGVDHPKRLTELNNLHIDYWVAKGMGVDKAKEKLSEIQSTASSMRGEVVSHWVVKYWTDKGLSEDAARAKVSEIQAKNASKSSFTVSKACTNFLSSVERICGIPIEREVRLCNRFLVDGLVRDKAVVIEFYGAFWHMHPSLFSPNEINRITGRKASSQWAEDGGRVKYLIKAGYKVIVVWEHEATEEMANKIAKELK